MLDGCHGAWQPPGQMVPTGTAASSRATRTYDAPPQYRVLFSFGGPSGNCSDGAWPFGGLISANGLLYGTTYAGGTYDSGTIFSITTNGVEQVFYNFEGAGYGGGPEAGVTSISGKLYGTTPQGGAYGLGAAYKIRTNSPLPIERILHSFGSGYDGATPITSLLAVGDRLYGTTTAGGAHGQGTVFRIDAKTGHERVLYSFGGGSDGKDPQATLMASRGKLYGTTTAGGPSGAGTVFSVDMKSGKERVLHAFGGGSDGQDPQAGLIAVNGTLYGTTAGGGAYGSDYAGGTVFSMSADGTNERIVHSFGNGQDGRDPQAGLIAENGTLYGTTAQGGAYTGSLGYAGTIYSIRLADGKERVLHNFGNGHDGAYPLAPVIDVNGTLYGTTVLGGQYFSICVQSGGETVGTVFALKP